VNSTLEYIIDKYNLNIKKKPPIVIDEMVHRIHLAKLFHELDFKIGVELGVERGLYTITLARENPQAHIIGIDAWQAYGDYRDHVSQEKINGFYFDAVKRLQPFNNVEFRREFSMDAVERFKNNELDFVYIDANHSFRYIAEDIVEWSKKVRAGGIVSGHDFRRWQRSFSCHVKDVVHAYTYSHGIKPWFVTAERSPSWFYVKG